MVSVHSFWFFQLSFVLIYRSPFVVAAPWLVTAAYEKVVATEPYYPSSTVVTRVKEITPTVTSLPEALSTTTSVASTDGLYYVSDDVTVVQKLYPTGVGQSVDPYDYYGYDYPLSDGRYHTTIFKVKLTYTAATGCSTQWTKTTAADVTPPLVAQNLLPRTAGATSTSVDSSQPFQPTTIIYDVVYVDPTQVPRSSLSVIRFDNRPTALYYGPGCDYSDNNHGTNYGYGNHDFYGHSYNWFMDSYWMGISPLALTLILTLGWVGLWLVLGFIEASVRFRRLMTGWQTRRGLPVCWSLTILPITLFLLCCFKKGYRARSQADAEILRRRWAAMSVWTKLRLFFVWGFRFKYPPMLGPAPARVKASKRPDKNPGPRLLTPSPPRSVAPDSRVGSVARSAPGSASQAEMAEASPPAVSGALPSQLDNQIGRAL